MLIDMFNFDDMKISNFIKRKCESKTLCVESMFNVQLSRKWNSLMLNVS